MDTSLLQAALIGYQSQIEKINAKIAEIQSQMGTSPTKSATLGVDGHPNGRRKMSAAARKRIADAQKKRWAEFHAKQTGK